MNGTNYVMVKYNVMPFADSDQITHYLLVCAKTNETQVAINQIINNFSYTYTVIFWVIISLAIVVFLSIALLVYFGSKKVSMQMKLIEKLIWKVIRRSLFPNITSKIEDKSYEKLERNSQGIETLIGACKDKINTLTNLEKKYSYYQWGTTRPTDELLYLDWSKCIYPLNNCSEHSTGWKKALVELNKVVG